MNCCHDYAFTHDGEQAFEVDTARVKYGSGVLREVGDDARDADLRRVALFTDALVGSLEPVATVKNALRAAGVDFAIYDAVRVEPTDASFKEAAAFAADGKFDGFISVGGGSVIDTCKAANLYSTYPADFMEYVNAPIGAGRPVPGPLKIHIACPTTSGTGSEVTAMAIFDLVALGAKTGIASRRLRPTLGVIDPDTTSTLPGTVVACSGFDVLCHALESYTALPFTQRKLGGQRNRRPISQGANPFSDMACSEALRILGKHIARAVRDAGDAEARERMMYAATLAGIGFGNAGCHVPHGMAYAVAGLVKEYHAPEYPGHEPIVPHGMSVIVNAPAVFRFTASASPERHLAAAEFLGAGIGDATPQDGGEILAGRIVALMRETGMPNGIGGVGFRREDVGPLTEGTFPQQRLLSNAPRPIGRDDLRVLFEAAFSYW